MLTDEELKQMPTTETPCTTFMLALALWCEQCNLSRLNYEKLREVILLLEHPDAQHLPRKLDTLRSHICKRVPLLPSLHRPIPVTSEVLPSHSTLPNSPATSTQFWYDMKRLFQSILESPGIRRKLHLGMATYNDPSDEPFELWQSRAWGSSVRAAGGDYAYSGSGECIFPGDFVEVASKELECPDPSAAYRATRYGRVVFFGKDCRANSVYKGDVVLKIQAIVLSSSDLLADFEPLPSEEYVLLEDHVFEIPAQSVSSRVRMQLLRPLTSISSLSPDIVLIKRVANARNTAREKPKYRSTELCHPLRGELEIEYFGRPHLEELSREKGKTLSLPFLLFVDDFGVHRNMYRAVKAFYAIPAGLAYSDRRKLSNTYVLTLGPHGADPETTIASFVEQLAELDRGSLMKVDGVPHRVSAFVLAFTGDMPQQAANAGFLTHNAKFGCRSCYCPKDTRQDLSFDVVLDGRYHHETRSKRWQGAAITGKRQQDFWQKYGMRASESPMVKLGPALDLILTRTYDIPHSEWKGLGRLMQELLIDTLLTKRGVQQYLRVFQSFPTPKPWPRIQSPARYIQSWSLSEAGRATIITPLILRCHASPGWFEEAFLKSFSKDDSRRATDQVIKAYATFALAISAVSFPHWMNKDSLHRIIIAGRRAFQKLHKKAAMVGSARGPGLTVAQKRLMKNRALPNVHAGLHLSEFAEEYGTLMNCNVLTGEARHK